MLSELVRDFLHPHKGFVFVRFGEH